MVHESFADQPGVQVPECPCIPVPFLLRRYPFRRDIRTDALIVFSDALMRLFVIILLQADRPQAVQLLKCLYFLSFYFVKKAVHDPVELFNLLSEYSDKRFYPQFFIIRTF